MRDFREGAHVEAGLLETLLQLLAAPAAPLSQYAAHHIAAALGLDTHRYIVTMIMMVVMVIVMVVIVMVMMVVMIVMMVIVMVMVRMVIVLVVIVIVMVVMMVVVMTHRALQFPFLSFYCFSRYPRTLYDKNWFICH